MPRPALQDHPAVRPALRAGLFLLLAAPLVGCDPRAEGRAAGAAPDESPARSLAVPPDPRVGEWWTVEVEPTLVGATYTTTLVVTDRTGDRATIGMAPAQFSHDFLVIHVPPLGDLDLSTFAWRVMRDDFAALRFPLEPGRTWTADFHGRDVTAEVTRVDGNRAFVTMLGDGQRIELVYDADMGMIVDFREEALGLGFRVTGHGFDHQGEALALTGIQLALMESPAAAPAHHGAQSAPPGRTVEVQTGASHGSLGLILWNVGYEDEAGTYRVSATAPDGTVFEETFVVNKGAPSVALKSFGHHAVDGSWQVEFERGGPAGLLVELFTYDQRRVRMP